MAHFTIYMVAGYNVAGFVNTYNKLKFEKKFLISILICIIYATSDEIHQMFVPGRACMFTDILIDAAGALTGVLILALFLKLKRSGTRTAS